MEDLKRNGHTMECTKKDKRRQQVATRLGKLESQFADDKNNYYRGLLHNLQTTLASIQQGSNEDFVEKKTQLEEHRDYELTRLRLWEEYQVKRVEDEYKESISTSTTNYDTMIKLLKEKYYDKLQQQAKQLKEDKLLLNLVNAGSWGHNNEGPGASSYSAVSALSAAAAASALSLNDRRSLRKREISARLAAGEADDVSDSADGSQRNGNNGFGANGSLASGYIAATAKRRRHYQTRYSSNDEYSTGVHNSGNNGNQSHSGAGSGHNGHHSPHNNGVNISGNDSNLSDKDYDTLNYMIMNNEEGGVSKIFSEREKASGRPNTRGSHKQIAGVHGLKPEELHDDLTLLRNAVKREK